MRKTIKKIIAITLVIVMTVAAIPTVGISLGIKSYAADYNNGDIIEFGSYPQSKVTDSELIAELEAQELNWISYNYYNGDGNYGSMVSGDWMKYADVEYNGEKYRCVNFSQYRPYYTFYASNTSNSWQSRSGYKVNNNYWFKYEPIQWTLLDKENGLVFCKSIIDSQAFNNLYYPDNGTINNSSENPILANDYTQSTVRQWLNNDFYKTAFSEHEMWSIKTTEIDNTAAPNFSQYNKESTNDKIFLLSYYDMINPDYGFSTNSYKDKTRDTKPTDYAKSQGVYVYANGYSKTRLRSAGMDNRYVCVVNNGGIVGTTSFTDVPDVGIRPALNIDFFRLNHVHSYTEKTIQPTCDKEGAIIRVCEGCGDSQTVSVIPAAGHIDADGNGICDVCQTVVDATKTCDHICHKTGFVRVFYKIALFFWKLFKINKYCSCGAAHY